MKLSEAFGIGNDKASLYQTILRRWELVSSSPSKPNHRCGKIAAPSPPTSHNSIKILSVHHPQQTILVDQSSPATSRTLARLWWEGEGGGWEGRGGRGGTERRRLRISRFPVSSSYCLKSSANSVDKYSAHSVDKYSAHSVDKYSAHSDCWLAGKREVEARLQSGRVGGVGVLQQDLRYRCDSNGCWLQNPSDVGSNHGYRDCYHTVSVSLGRNIALTSSFQEKLLASVEWSTLRDMEVDLVLLWQVPFVAELEISY